MTSNPFNPKHPMMKWIARKGWGVKDRNRFYSKLAAFLKNGKRLQVSVDDLLVRAKRRGETDLEAIVLADISHELRRGVPFGKAMMRFVPASESALLLAGEKGGDLPATLLLACELNDASAKMKSVAIGALVSPLVSALMILASLFMISYYVVPRLTPVMDPALWEGVAKSLYIVSEILQSPWIALPLVIVAVVFIIIIATLKTWTGKTRVLVDSLPPWSFYRLVVGGGWMLSLAALVKSGTTISVALNQLRASADPWLYERITSLMHEINKGKNLGVALEATGYNFPDKGIIDDFTSYSELPNFDDVLYREGKNWVTEGVAQIEKQAFALKSTMSVVMGVVMMWFAYGTMDIQNQISQYFLSL
jgi:type II secretory pathway component PulF